MLNSTLSKNKDWSKLLFFGVLLSYIRLYAPYGINETDGGFITAHAWRLLQGELMYLDNIYIRPPLPILLRYLELLLLPENWAIFAEKVFFYLKVGAYSYLGAAILYKSNRLWFIATLAFIISVHSYPAAAWHTIDGILFSVLTLYCFYKQKPFVLVIFLTVLSLLCKQSFYPMLPLVLLFYFMREGIRGLMKSIIAVVVYGGLLFLILYSFNLQQAYFHWTSGAGQLGDLIQHGIKDFWSINKMLWGWSLLLLGLVWEHPYRKYIWYVFLTGLILSFLRTVYIHQSFSVPIAQSRLLFLITSLYVFFQFWKEKRWQIHYAKWFEQFPSFFKYVSLIAVSWMAAISWGYNFPILFALPWIALADLITKRLEFGTASMGRGILRILLLILLIGVFRYSHEFVYRDGNRSEMKYALSEVFPKLRGIYSTKETYDKYTELKMLHQKYGPHFKTLPTFPLSNYLTNTNSPLPQDWVIHVETNHQTFPAYTFISNQQAVCFLEKEYEHDIKGNPRYQITEELIKRMEKVEETEYFKIYQLE